MRREIVPPSKLIVTNKYPPRGWFLIRGGFLLRGGEISVLDSANSAANSASGTLVVEVSSRS